MKIKSKTKQNWVNLFVQYPGLDRMEQVNSVTLLPVTDELLKVFTLCYAINAGRQIGQCWSTKFPGPYNTQRRRVAKEGEGNIRYVAGPSGTRFHTCLVTVLPANQ